MPRHPTEPAGYPSILGGRTGAQAPLGRGLRHSRRHRPRRNIPRLSMVAVLASVGISFGDLTAHGQTPLLDLPLECTPGTDCWVAYYVDNNPVIDKKDPYRETADYRCGSQAVEAGQTTGIAIRDLRVMKKGVAVIAAADGRVIESRDHIPDRLFNPQSQGNPEKGHQCGNRIALDHGEGLVTVYCHLARGSLLVEAGQTVHRGEPMANIGLSGKTNFPHLSFGVGVNGKAVDPFTGLAAGAGCKTPPKGALWTERALRALTYRPVKIYNLGFTDRILNQEEALTGNHAHGSLSADSPILLFWADIFGIRKNDILEMVVIDAAGQEVARHERQFDKHYRRFFIYTGRQFDEVKLKPGIYQGRITVNRRSMKISNKAQVTIR